MLLIDYLLAPRQSALMPASKPFPDTDAQHGDAVGRLYGEHHGWLLSWLRHKLGFSHLAADLAHDTFLRVLAGRTGLALLQPRAYLRTIAHGLAVNHWRRLDIERAYLDALAGLPEAMAPSPEERLLVLETLRQLDNHACAARCAFQLRTRRRARRGGARPDRAPGRDRRA